MTAPRPEGLSAQLAYLTRDRTGPIAPTWAAMQQQDLFASSSRG